MEDSLCQRCQTLPSLEEKPFKAILFAEADMLQEKTKNLLHSIPTLRVRDEEDLLIVEGPSFNAFLRVLVHWNLAQNEEEDIQIAPLKVEDTISLSALKKVRSLKNYLNCIRNQEILEMLQRGNLITYFQPVIQLKDRKVYGFECLLRGKANDGTLIPPHKIFDAAHGTGLLFYVDRAARESAVRSAAQHEIRDRKVFVNFIPTTIYDPRYCLQTTLELSRKVGFDPENLVFEVVESYKVTDLDHLKSILDYYKSQGFKTALDDVGSGFSNQNSLVRLRPDYLKVDMELVRGIHLDSMKQSVFKALGTIAKENGITLLAEGVETKEELEFLAYQGADLVQGYYFGKPSPEPSCSF